MDRNFHVCEIGGRMFVATPVAVPPGVPVDWMVCFARRDGTEAVVVTGIGGRPHCSCLVPGCGHVLAMSKPAPAAAAAPPSVQRGMAALWGLFGFGGGGRAVGTGDYPDDGPAGAPRPLAVAPRRAPQRALPPAKKAKYDGGAGGWWF